MPLGTIVLSLVFYGFNLATADPTSNWASFLGNASGPVILGLLVIGAVQEWWVPGRTHRRTVAERDALLTLALHGQEVGNKALDTASILAAAAHDRKVADS